MALVNKPSLVPYWRLSGFYFFYFAFLGAWAPYWNLYLDDLGVSASSIGSLAAVVMITKVIAPSIWGLWADRSGQRLRIIRFGAFMATVVFAGFLVTQQWWWLFALTLLYSFFWNAILAQFEVVTLAHLAEKAHTYSRIRLWGSIGFVATVAGFGYVFDYFSIRLLPWFLWLLLMGIWLSSLWVPATESAKVAEQGHDKAELKQIILRPSVLAFLLCCFLLQVAHGPYYTFFSLFLEQHGYQRGAIGLLWALGVLAEILLFIVMHTILARFSLRLIILVTFKIAVIRWLLIAWFVDNIWVLALAQLAHAATFGAFHAVSIEFIRRQFGRNHQGQGQAIYSGLSFGAGGAVGALASGLIWDWQPLYSFYMASLACLLAWFIAYFYWDKPKVSRSQREAS